VTLLTHTCAPGEAQPGADCLRLYDLVGHEMPRDALLVTELRIGVGTKTQGRDPCRGNTRGRRARIGRVRRTGAPRSPSLATRACALGIGSGRSGGYQAWLTPCGRGAESQAGQRFGDLAAHEPSPSEHALKRRRGEAPVERADRPPEGTDIRNRGAALMAATSRKLTGHSLGSMTISRPSGWSTRRPSGERSTGQPASRAPCAP
jgi:hypothetical protein